MGRAKAQGEEARTPHHNNRARNQQSGRPDPRAQRSTKQARAELIRESRSNIKDTRSAKEWLTDREHIVPDEDITLGAMAMALLKEAGDNSTAHAALVDTARAVALCLEQSKKQASYAR